MKKTKVFLAIAAMTSLAFSLAACNSSGGKDNASPSASSSAVASQPASTESAAPLEEVTLKVRGTDPTPIPGVQNNDIANEIAKKLGIKIDYSTKDETKDKVALAGGDLPDIMQIDNKDLSTYIKGDHIIPLDDLVAQYGSDITKNASGMLTYSKDNLSDGTGKLYGLTAGQFVNVKDYPSTSYVIGLTIRWDYYKEMGYPPINNEDDYLKVLSDMKKLHPKTADGKNIYGISLWSDWGLWPYFVPYSFANGYMNGSNWTVVDPQGNATPMFSAEGGVFKNALKFLNKAYNMGLVDPESFTQKNADFLAKNKNLQLLSAPSLWWQADAQATMQAQGIKDGGFYVIPGATPHTWQGYGSKVAGALSDRVFVISKNSKHPERAMQLLNFLYSYEGSRLLASGVEGVQWNRDSGSPELTDATLEAMKTDKDFAQKTGIGLYNNLNGLSGTSNDSRDDEGNLLNLNFTAKAIATKTTEADKDFSQHYGAATPAEVFQKFNDEGKSKIDNFENTYAGFYPALPNDLQLINGKIDTYSKTWAPKLIMAKNDAEFEKIWKSGVDAMNSMGLDKQIAWELEQNKIAVEKAGKYVK